MNLKYDIFAKSLSKCGEQFCGDYYLISQRDEKTRIVLADGIGNGFTANLRATMTAKMLMSLVESVGSAKKAVNAVISGMTSNNNSAADYCAFLLFEIDDEGNLETANYNMPDPVFLHCGKAFSPNITIMTVNDRKIKIFQSKFLSGDTAVLISDGIIKAGIGTSLDFGLGRENVVSYLEASYKTKITSKKTAELLLNVCSSLYLEKPTDDFSAVVVKAQKSNAKAMSDGE